MPNPDRDSPAAAVLDALGIAVFIHAWGALRISGQPPDWLRSIWPAVAAPDATLPDSSPFLENFLIDARACWAAGGENRARSGAWVEQTAAGIEITLEATALTAGGQSILLLERLGEVFEAKRSMLQKARETVIAYQRLDSEVQKKEILLNCISEEMSAALANVITALRLIELERDPVRIAQLLGLASLATQEQQTLINKVLNVFADELEGLYGHKGSARAEANLGDVLRGAEENVASQFDEKRVRLCIADGGLGESRVSMNSGHLTRALSILLENGLQNAADGGEVHLYLAEEPESVLIRVFDNGSPLPHDVCEDFFSKTRPVEAEPQSSRLSLQFCRIAVENCHGEIGYEPDEGGNCFWIRLPKAVSTR
jgi:signal transduction histidine kinase